MPSSTWSYSGGAAAPALPGNVRPPLAALDWLVAAAEEEPSGSSPGNSTGRLSNGSVGQVSAVSSAESEADGLEKEAKVDRRVSRC